MFRFRVFALAFFAWPLSAAAEDGGFCDVLSFQVENDETARTDRYYTGGLRVACTGEASPKLDSLSWPKPPAEADVNRRLTVSLGQSVFTPDDLTEAEPIEDDHPYAGWLYLGLGLDTEVVPEAEGALPYLDRLELQLGIVGPWSGAEQLQRVTHDVVDATDPAGWGNQLDNEPGINFFLSRQWTGAARADLTRGGRLPDLSFDLSPVVGAALGNIFIFGGAGMTARLGSFDELDHGHALIRPGLAGADGFRPQKGFSAYIFGGVEGRFVGRNIFLDGNSFQDDGPSVERELVVGELRAGFAMTYKRTRLSFTQAYRTSEFEDGDGHGFGSITLAIAL